MGFKLKCPQCELKFSYNPSEGWPERCRAIQKSGKKGCGFDLSLTEEQENVISVPAFLSSKTKATDGVARDIMNGSEFRVEAAAQMAGVDKSEMSSLKITNLNDRNDAETAIIPVRNEVTKVMEAAPGVTGFQANGAAFAAGTRAGPHPNAGARAASMLQSAHQRLQGAVEAGGKRG